MASHQEPGLEASVRLALRDMQAEVSRRREAIAAEMAARGTLHSEATVRRFVQALLGAARVTLDRLVDAHLAAGAADVEETAAAIRKEFEPCVTPHLEPQFRYPDPSDSAAMKRAWAGQQQAAVPLLDSIADLVRERLAGERPAPAPSGGHERPLDRWIHRAKEHPVIAAVVIGYLALGFVLGQGPLFRTVWSWLARIGR
jgi:hypothetical protein